LVGVVAATIALTVTQGVVSAANASTSPGQDGMSYSGFVTGFGAAAGRASLRLPRMHAPFVGVASMPDGTG